MSTQPDVRISFRREACGTAEDGVEACRDGAVVCARGPDDADFACRASLLGGGGAASVVATYGPCEAVEGRNHRREVDFSCRVSRWPSWNAPPRFF